MSAWFVKGQLRWEFRIRGYDIYFDYLQIRVTDIMYGCIINNNKLILVNTQLSGFMG